MFAKTVARRNLRVEAINSAAYGAARGSAQSNPPTSDRYRLLNRGRGSFLALQIDLEKNVADDPLDLVRKAPFTPSAAGPTDSQIRDQALALLR